MANLSATKWYNFEAFVSHVNIIVVKNAKRMSQISFIITV